MARSLGGRARNGRRTWAALQRDREALHVENRRHGWIADRIDYWIRQHVIPYCHGTYVHPSQSKWNPARHRRVRLTAIGQCLKDQYDALATPIPAHLSALVKQLETEEQG